MTGEDFYTETYLWSVVGDGLSFQIYLIKIIIIIIFNYYYDNIIVIKLKTSTPSVNH